MLIVRSCKGKAFRQKALVNEGGPYCYIRPSIERLVLTRGEDTANETAGCAFQYSDPDGQSTLKIGRCEQILHTSRQIRRIHRPVNEFRSPGGKRLT